jgi:hypothetical protein
MQTSERTELAAKLHVLKDGGYAYNFDILAYFNRRTRKAFSVQFIEDHSASELEKCIREPIEGGAWRLYFNSPPSESVRRQVELALG